ncbi:FecR domain-containing protein [uncultured Draconibacterium sp.]|uniref:FecR family protein n=1 Tax=uncultured Draconibacterium sp. TaxID=1573823 RepID=UPI0032609849
MSEKKLHSKALNHLEKDLFEKGKINWNRSEEDIWATLQREIDDKPANVVSFKQDVIQWVAAAVIFVLVGLLGVVSTYHKTINCLPGERMTAELPDGSTVEMNAASKLVYYPLKWKLERKVNFEGEGFFNVEKGSKFTVKSKYGSTQVLGTSFNIFARDKKYRVTCLTGKVQVHTGKDETVVLLPQNHAELEEGKLVLTKMFNTEKAVSWKQNFFFFAGRPLKEVIDEIERQYAVTIKLDPELNNRNFGSNFSKQHSVEDVLDFVCKPMSLKYTKQNENVYFVTEES